MYNAFIVKKRTIEEEKVNMLSQRNHQYVQRYLGKTRPSLIEDYNKRINSFIRRMEEEPIKINEDPYTKTPKDKIEVDLMQSINPNEKAAGNSEKLPVQARKRAVSHMNWDERGNSMSINHETIGSHYYQFKYKDNEDFKSLFTQW